MRVAIKTGLDNLLLMLFMHHKSQRLTGRESQVLVEIIYEYEY